MATRFRGLPAGGSRGGIRRVAGSRGLFHTGRSASQQSGNLYARRQGWTDRETNQDPPSAGAGSFHVRPPSGGSSVGCRNDDGADRCARYTPAVAAGVCDRLDDGRGRFDLRARLHASVAGSGAPATPAGRAATRSDRTTRPVGGGGFGATTISSPSGGVSPRTAAPERAWRVERGAASRSSHSLWFRSGGIALGAVGESRKLHRFQVTSRGWHDLGLVAMRKQIGRCHSVGSSN